MKGKKTKEQFVADARKVHGNKYDYSKVEYKGCHVEVEIICPKHGSFLQTPTNHLLGHGCIKCRTEERANHQRRTTEEFVAQARRVHGDKYNYDKTEYINKRTKVCVTCPKHGDFWQNAQSHLLGCGCKECMKESFRITYENFIERAKEIHGDRYDYSLITKENFNGASSLVDIICPYHGVFRQKAINHLNGNGCPQCAYDLLHDSKVMPKEEFLRRVNELYGDRFDMSKVDFVNVNTPITVICKEHGEFYVKPRYFLRGYGCPQCDGFGKYTTDRFVSLAKQKHGDKYDYSLVDYKYSREPVEIICKKCGAHFLQTPNSHLQGSGCPHCLVYYGEKKVSEILNKYNVQFISQYEITNSNLSCKNKKLFVDFFIPTSNTIIEYNGQQHYEAIDYFGGQERFERQKERDNAVRMYCKEHKIKLIEIPYTEFDNIENILTKRLNHLKNCNAYGNETKDLETCTTGLQQRRPIPVRLLPI